MTRAIVVEPDESIRKLQRLILERFGIDEIIEKETPGEALAIYSSEHFDFAMLDISVATEDMRKFLHVSRKEQKTPVIAFSTRRISRETMQILVSDHVFAVFPKPFDLDEVIASVKAGFEAARTGTLHPTFYGILQKLHMTKE